MKMDFSKGELATLLVALGAFCIGLLRLSHTLRLSETSETTLWFVLALGILACRVRAPRFAGIAGVVWWLCFAAFMLSLTAGSRMSILDFC